MVFMKKTEEKHQTTVCVVADLDCQCVSQGSTHQKAKFKHCPMLMLIAGKTVSQVCRNISRSRDCESGRTDD